MGENSEISWTDHTINLWWGCTKVSPGCANCYADTLSRRFGKDVWGPGKPREDHRKNAIKTALKLNRDAGRAFENFKTGVTAGADMRMPHRPRVFSASMSDWLDDEVPIEWLADLLDLIRQTPNLDWLLLTKRPEDWRKRIGEASEFATKELYQCHLMLRAWCYGDAPANVWIGTTVENQAMADKRIPELLSIPAKVRFLSCEPLLEALDIEKAVAHPLWGWNITDGIHWVIAGGESGPGFRPFDPDWARSLRDQCKAAGVAFHMKQMGGLRPSSMPPIPQDLQIRKFPTP